MSNQTPETPVTKAGTSKTSTKELGPTRNELNLFHEAVAIALESKAPGQVPEIEAPRVIIEHFNRQNLKGFEDAGYFMFQGVKVFEEGRVDDVKKREAKSIEERLHGGTPSA